MRLIGFHFDKINVERFKDKIDTLKINSKIDISQIKKIESDIFKTKEDIIEVKFSYDIIYEPDFAKIELKGNVLLAIDSKMAKEILEQWKNKQISEDFKVTVFNIILRKSSIKALQLEDEMSLPIHISLPLVKKQNTEKE